jgi:hypothetical protein
MHCPEAAQSIVILPGAVLERGPRFTIRHISMKIILFLNNILKFWYPKIIRSSMLNLQLIQYSPQNPVLESSFILESVQLIPNLPMKLLKDIQGILEASTFLKAIKH